MKPFFQAYDNQQPVIVGTSVFARSLAIGDLLTQAQCLSDRFPERTSIVNLCSHKSSFLVTWMAAVLSRTSMLLPQNETPEVLAALCDENPDLCFVWDKTPLVDVSGCSRIQLDPITQLSNQPPGQNTALPSIDPDYWRQPDTVVLFTSGSTGAPRPQCKSLQQLFMRAKQTAEAVVSEGIKRVVTTVPLQHMYGLENGLLLPLVAGLALQESKPFYPADIAAEVSSDSLLVSTPMHLQYCLDSDLDFPPAGCLLSATAALEPEPAKMLEQRFDCPLIEIYGSTESGVIATRRTAVDICWTPLPGLRIEVNQESAALIHADEQTGLSDRFEVYTDGRFRLLGRDQDLVKIAGKRHSFSALDYLLKDIEGVDDGVFFIPDTQKARLCALVVSRLDVKTIQAALRRKLDPVFIPRPLLKVARLPRNSLGKLPRDALLQAFAQARQQAEDPGNESS
ncbi:AMP-binding protein [Aestuariirhabdus sp. Z084]|uniref:AMP-binding protein n=1 Tax=Aestuariirhabdus haliotis TaxID=2918751 RepID=UPI00201B3E1F|nr:AMP-binding protein [Aestuariirhabdus haliotis]MCL6415857.1 AMP-binding protein [Aestuariirhabdus haliotis]MCL6419841.1 AMP-binding protein [Aestuariirhabdus haliotis]